VPYTPSEYRDERHDIPRPRHDLRALQDEEIDQIAGVEAVQVDLEAKLVRVSGTGVDDAAVVAAIDEAGYEAVRA
jgi:hypothetical protein